MIISSNFVQFHNFSLSLLHHLNFSATFQPLAYFVRITFTKKKSFIKNSLYLKFVLWHNIQGSKIWLYSTKFDEIWQNLTKFDKIWQNLTKFDKIWQNLTILGNYKWYFHPISFNFIILRFHFCTIWIFSATFQPLLNFKNFRLVMRKQWRKTKKTITQLPTNICVTRLGALCVWVHRVGSHPRQKSLQETNTLAYYA